MTGYSHFESSKYRRHLPLPSVLIRPEDRRDRCVVAHVLRSYPDRGGESCASCREKRSLKTRGGQGYPVATAISHKHRSPPAVPPGRRSVRVVECEPAAQEQDGAHGWRTEDVVLKPGRFRPGQDQGDAVAVGAHAPHPFGDFLAERRIEPDAAGPGPGKAIFADGEMIPCGVPGAINRGAGVQIERAKQPDEVRRGEPFILPLSTAGEFDAAAGARVGCKESHDATPIKLPWHMTCRRGSQTNRWASLGGAASRQ